MKMKLFLLILNIFFVFSLSGQIVVTSKIINVPCCNNSDSIDYNSDGTYDLSIESFEGIDSKGFTTRGIGNIQLTGPYDFGQTLDFYYTDGPLTGTTLLCYGWYSFWEPGTGTVKYVGFRDIIAVNDTVFGWIKVDFNGTQNTCEVTMMTSTVAYSQTPNFHLTAGQTTPSSIQEYSEKIDNLFEFISNQEGIYLINKSITAIDIKLYNTIGQEVFCINKLTSGQSKIISNSKISNGVFFIIGSTGTLRQTNKVYIK